MSTKKIGTLLENEVELALRKSGASVSLPRGDDEPYDLVADINGKLYRIQVKASRTRNNGESFSFNCTHVKRGGAGTRLNIPYEDGEIDYFATVYKDQSYLVPSRECRLEKQLRIAPMRNKRKYAINWAKDYELERVVDKLMTTEL